MITCNTARDKLALDPHDDAPELSSHLATCNTCAAYRRQHTSLDMLLRAELSFTAPDALTARLLALAANPLAAMAMPRLRPAPKAWYVKTVSFLTIAAILTSVLVIWQFVLLMLAQFGITDALAQLAQAPAQGLDLIAQSLPQGRAIVDLALLVRDQALWLLLAAVLWVLLDKTRTPGRLPQHQAR